MPSFDVVSEVNHHELSNAVDQANREVTTRFDFKGTGSNFDLAGNLVNMNTQSEFQLQQRISQPIRELAQGMRNVTESQDYTLRLPALGRA